MAHHYGRASPDFATKAARVLDLYQRVVDGEAPGHDDYVISADEKSQLQALRRCHLDLAPGPGHLPASSLLASCRQPGHTEPPWTR